VDHDDATAMFSAYCDKQLGVPERAALDEHLQSCLVCRRELAKFEATVESVHKLHPMSAPPDFVAGVRDRIHKRSRGRFFRPGQRGRMPIEVVSLVTLGVVLAVYLVVQLLHPQLRLP